MDKFYSRFLRKCDVTWLQPHPHKRQIPEILYILSEKKHFCQRVLEMIIQWC